MPQTMEPLVKHVLPAGIKRVVHVLVTALQSKSPDVWAIRSERQGMMKMALANEVTINGPVSGITNYNAPLPGTNNRGVALLHTQAEILVVCRGKLKIIDVPNDQPPAAALEKPPQVLEKDLQYVWYTTQTGPKAGTRKRYIVLKEWTDRYGQPYVRIQGTRTNGELHDFVVLKEKLTYI